MFDLPIKLRPCSRDGYQKHEHNKNLTTYLNASTPHKTKYRCYVKLTDDLYKNSLIEPKLQHVSCPAINVSAL